MSIIRKRYVPAVFDNFIEPWPASSVSRIMRNMLDGMGMAGPFFDDGESYVMPRVDFYRKDGKLFIEAELPGIDPKDVDLQIYHDRLIVVAEKKSEKKEEGDEQAFIRSERWYGKIERSVAFPVEVNPDTAKASFKHGVLTVEVEENVRPQGYRKLEITSTE